MRTLDDLDDVGGKRVLVRVDFNVPLDQDGAITDDARIRGALPTLRELRDKGARLVLLSHLGRPKGRDAAFSLRPAAERAAELLGEEVVLAAAYVNDAFGSAHRAQASTEAVAHLLPHAAGRLLEREVTTLNGILEEPRRPLVAIVGGAKVTDKIGVLQAFL